MAVLPACDGRPLGGRIGVLRRKDDRSVGGGAGSSPRGTASLVVPVDAFLVVVELHLFRHPDPSKGIQHDLLLLGREERFSFSPLVVGVAPEPELEDRHERLVLRRVHPALHPGEAPRVGHRGGVAEVRAGLVAGTEGRVQQP